MNPLADDLDRLLDGSPPAWRELDGAHLFVTGGTGFVGCWLLETLLWAVDRLHLNASATVLTRDARRFTAAVPHLATHRAVRLVEGDVRSVNFPDEPFSHVVHAAFDSAAPPGRLQPADVFDTIVTGTRRTLEFAARAGAGRLLLVSSGAVYGSQPAELAHMPEDWIGGPTQTDRGQVYGEAKRAAEMLCAIHASSSLKPVIARGFAFVGPYLPVGAHFAAGNFIRDALDGGPVQVEGDGLAVRSYMYGGDLAIWLWTILMTGETLHPYNVGSDEPVTIAELAHLVARSVDAPVSVRIRGASAPGGVGPRYVPSIARAGRELGLHLITSLPDALRKTIAWHRQRTVSRHASH